MQGWFLRLRALKEPLSPLTKICSYCWTCPDAVGKALWPVDENLVELGNCLASYVPGTSHSDPMAIFPFSGHCLTKLSGFAGAQVLETPFNQSCGQLIRLARLVARPDAGLTLLPFFFNMQFDTVLSFSADPPQDGVSTCSLMEGDRRVSFDQFKQVWRNAARPTASSAEHVAGKRTIEMFVRLVRMGKATHTGGTMHTVVTPETIQPGQYGPHYLGRAGDATFKARAAQMAPEPPLNAMQVNYTSLEEDILRRNQHRNVTHDTTYAIQLSSVLIAPGTTAAGTSGSGVWSIDKSKGAPWKPQMVGIVADTQSWHPCT